MAKSRPLKATFHLKKSMSIGSPSALVSDPDRGTLPDSHESSLTSNRAKTTLNRVNHPAAKSARTNKSFAYAQVPILEVLEEKLQDPESKDRKIELHTQLSPPKKRGRPCNSVDTTSPLHSNGVIKSAPSATATRRAVRSNGQCQTVLPIISELCKAKYLRPGERHKAVQHLRTDQLESLENILEQPIQPTLQKWIDKNHEKRCSSILVQQAETIVEELVCRHLFAILPTSSDSTPMEHRKEVKRKVRGIMKEKFPCHKRPTLATQPIAGSCPVEDLSMLEAGQAIPENRANPPHVMSSQYTSTAPMRPSCRNNLQSNVHLADEGTVVYSNTINSPKRPPGRPRKSREWKSSTKATAPGKDIKNRQRSEPRIISSVASPRIEDVVAPASREPSNKDAMGETCTATEFEYNLQRKSRPSPDWRVQQRRSKLQRQINHQSRLSRCCSTHSHKPRRKSMEPVSMSLTRTHRGQGSDALHHLTPTIASDPSIVLCKRRPLGLTDEMGLSSSAPKSRFDNNGLQDDLHVAYTWQRASGDIITGAWHHESNHYIVGATATTDPLSLQYNRPYNLLFGNMIENTVQELNDHCIDAPKSVNSVSKLFMTVETARFARNKFYTASHDKTVRIWDASSKPICLDTLSYDHEASVLDVSSRGALAVGLKTTDKSIHVYGTDDHSSSAIMESSRARDKPEQEIYPSCLTWGTSPRTENYLLAGFLRWGELEDGGVKKEGHLCLWDITTSQAIREVVVKPSAQGVYTTTWCPMFKGFAAGGIPGTQASLSNRRMRSVVRLWDLREPPNRYTFELECPARDQGEVSFRPWDDNLLVVTCTDGATYAYDCRQPDEVLHRLPHGDPIENNWITGLDSLGQTREEGDGGVMLCQWGGGRDLLYTGSSDGVLKTWDIRRASEDVFIGDLARLESGITFGSFSPDYSRLLVGDASGGVHILSYDQRDADYLDDPITGEAILTPRQIELLYTDASPKRLATSTVQDDNPGTEGIYLARDDIVNGRLLTDPHLGVVQGPNYEGPFNNIDIHRPRNSRAQKGLLEERRRTLALSRRAARKQRKRSRHQSEDSSSQGPPIAKRAKLGKVKGSIVEVIDLTCDDDDGVGAAPPAPPPAHRILANRLPTGRKHVQHEKTVSSRQRLGTSPYHASALSWEELLEDDHWFPDEDPMAIGCYMGVEGMMG